MQSIWLPWYLMLVFPLILLRAVWLSLWILPIVECMYSITRFSLFSSLWLLISYFIILLMLHLHYILWVKPLIIQLMRRECLREHFVGHELAGNQRSWIWINESPNLSMNSLCLSSQLLVISLANIEIFYFILWISIINDVIE